jgi:hypothetical protein
VSKTIRTIPTTITVLTRRGDHVLPDVYSDTSHVFAIGRSSADAIAMATEIALADPFQRAPRQPRSVHEVFAVARLERGK